MKGIRICAVFVIFLGLFSCSGTKEGVTPVTQNSSITYTNLADYLRQNSNVAISGEGNLVRLQIRGINSIQGDTRPFIYIDKMALGRDYNKANSIVNPNNIKRVEVISSLSRLAVYGEDGHAGVIKIHTKKDMVR